MSRTALLIGAETHGLTGVGNDLDTMADQLARRGFATLRCTGPDATRAGILDSYERLIRDTRHGDAVVVYYSGHGGLAGPPPALARYGRAAPPRLQFIVPTDYAGATESDFRGITAPELSVLLARLANATPNVTVVLDTCHAAHMSRDKDLHAKALLRPAYVDIAEHLSRLRHKGLDTTVRHVLGNQDAVRIVACGREQSAYEYTNGAGRRIGVLTEAIALGLADTGGQPVTWAGLLQQVRRRVQNVVRHQRPEAEGPALRLLFQTQTAQPSGTDRWQVPEPADNPLGAPVTIEWGRVIGGRAHPLPAKDATVHADEHVYLRVRCDGDTTVYVSLVGIDILSRVSPITSLDPSGIALRPGEEHVVGRDELDGRLVGIPLRWPPGVGRGAPRPAAFVVIVSSAPQDVWEPVAGPYRDLDVGESSVVHRDVRRISFRLDPAPAPVAVPDSRRK